MGRGRCYTKEENKALKELRTMFPEDNMGTLSKKAVALNVCPGRSAKAIHEHYKKMFRPAPKKPEPVQITLGEVPTEDNVRNVYKDLYEDLISTIFRNARLYHNGYEDGMFIDIPSLRKWLKKNEADRYYNRVNELVGMSYIQKI